MGGADWAELALVSRADQWVAAHPYLFVVSTAKLVRPARATGTLSGMAALRPRESLLTPSRDRNREPTGAFRLFDAQKASGGAEASRSASATGGAATAAPATGAATGAAAGAATSAPADRGARPLVLPLRKIQPTFPSMITVGRTDNNDLVVPDEQISKFHAFFRLVDDRVELSDAGSRNGTFVGSRKLEPRGVGAPVRVRDKFSFGAVEFQLFDARGCWEFLRQLERF